MFFYSWAESQTSSWLANTKWTLENISRWVTKLLKWRQSLSENEQDLNGQSRIPTETKYTSKQTDKFLP